MATRYILVGGYHQKAADGGRAFAEELTKGLEGSVKILECLFARPQDEWEKAYNGDIQFFNQFVSDKKLEFKLATLEGFIEEIQWADVIFIRGGTREDYLVELFQGWRTKLEKVLSNKILAGTSAGADVISTYYYDLDHLKVKSGLGLVPKKVIVHYRSDYNAPNINWDTVKTELENYKESLPVITLAEGEFVIL